MKNGIPKLWADSLDLETDWIMPLIENDKDIMFNFGIAKLAIEKGKYRNDKRRQRMKLQAVKGEFIDCFLVKYLKKKNVVIKLKNKIVMEEWRRRNSYEYLMEELDKLIDKKPEPEKPFIDEEVLQKYIDKNNGCPFRGKQEYLYFEKTGRDRFKYSQVGLDFYDKTGIEPWRFIETKK